MAFICGLFNAVSSKDEYVANNDESLLLSMIDASKNGYGFTSQSEETFVYNKSPVWCAVEQPVCNQYRNAIFSSENYVVTFDGIHYSTIESDSQDNPSRYISRMISEEGYLGLQQLVGDFVISVVDLREHALYLYRSPFGIRPVVYFWKNHHSRIAWASSIAQLEKLPEVNLTVSEEYIADYLCTAATANLRNTPYAHVYHVLPGECVRIDSSSLRTLFTKDIKVDTSIAKRNKSDLIEEFRYLFFEAVRCRLKRATPEIFIDLSGGLDSSAVACVSSIITQNEIVPAKLIFAHTKHEGDGNEISYAEAVASKTQRELRILPAKNIDLFALISSDMRLPIYEPSTLVLGGIPKKIVQEPRKVRLTGIGGDQLLAGNPFYPAGLIANKKYIEAFRALRDLAVKQKRAFSYVTYHYVYSPLCSPYSRVKELSFCTKNELFTEEFLQRWAIYDRINCREIPNRYAPDLQREYEELLLGEQWVSRDGDHYNQVRHPFLDWRLAEFCLSLPWHLKRSPNSTKIILREALKDLLPGVVVFRQNKAMHDITFVQAARAHHDSIWSIVKKSPLVRSGVISKKKYEELVSRFEYGSLYHVHGFLKVLSLDFWLYMKNVGRC